MSKVKYIAVLERGPEGYGVFFPDLPGCTSAGETVEEALSGAAEALSGHLEVMADEGMAIPPPSFTHSRADFADLDVVALPLIEAETAEAERTNPVRLNVSLPEALVAKIDASATAHGLTRSGLLAVASRQWINSNPAAPADRPRNPLWLKGQRRRRDTLTPSA